MTRIWLIQGSADQQDICVSKTTMQLRDDIKDTRALCEAIRDEYPDLLEAFAPDQLQIYIDQIEKAIITGGVSEGT